MTATLSLLLALAVPVGTAQAIPAQQMSAIGNWSGRLFRSHQALDVRITFASSGSGEYSGDYSADSQAIMDYPFDSVSAAGSHIDAILGGGDIRLHGKVGDNEIAGTFDGDEGTGTFVLHRTAPLRLPYRVLNVSFKDGDAVLSGTLCIPSTHGRHPAVVLLHGSGPETRWGTSRFIADRLARQGIAALIYDKRGSGASTGDWRTVGYDALADDTIAGIRLLKLRDDINPREIGIWGHSQGAFIAPLIAYRSRGDVAFIVAADGNASTNEEQDLVRIKNEIRDQGWTGTAGAQALALYEEFLQVAAAGGKVYERLAQDVEREKNEPWTSWIGIPPLNSWLYKWYPLVSNYDSRTYWAAVRIPVLLVYGQNDELSDVPGSIATIRGLVRDAGGPPVTSIVIPGAPHTLHIAPANGQAFFWWYMVPAYPADEISWIVRLVHPKE